jgi:hypothetical protein
MSLSALRDKPLSFAKLSNTAMATASATVSVAKATVTDTVHSHVHSRVRNVKEQAASGFAASLHYLDAALGAVGTSAPASLRTYKMTLDARRSPSTTPQRRRRADSHTVTSGHDHESVSSTDAVAVTENDVASYDVTTPTTTPQRSRRRTDAGYSATTDGDAAIDDVIGGHVITKNDVSCGDAAIDDIIGSDGADRPTVGRTLFEDEQASDMMGFVSKVN